MTPYLLAKYIRFRGKPIKILKFLPGGRDIWPDLHATLEKISTPEYVKNYVGSMDTVRRLILCIEILW